MSYSPVSKIWKLGTRGSPLALTQSRGVALSLQQRDPNLKIEEVIIETSGDRYTGDRLADAGGKALFVKEIEEALLTKKVDFAVHSLKDVPGILPQGLMLAAFPPREDARDAFLSVRYASFDALPRGARLGTSSPRREMQIRAMRPDLVILPVRGNIDTRLKKIENGEYDALVLAAAGLHRLNKKNVIRNYFDPDVLIPAVGQGVLGIETRVDEKELISFLKTHLEERVSSLTARAERMFLEKMGGDCYTPLAGYARLQGETLHLVGWMATPDGQRNVRLEKSGPSTHPEELGAVLAGEVLHAIAHHTLS
ncbi:MAG: hydroxymethylbilane synthase [Deltaproteobacteria bacterium]|nr:hydroxymethylbilane synthase [Deltaproteobacteria bacterium]